MLIKSLAVVLLVAPLWAQKPQDTEVWTPVPKVVTPGATDSAPPSDAVVLFDGKNLDEWVQVSDKSPAKWSVGGGVLTVIVTSLGLHRSDAPTVAVSWVGL